MPTSRPYFLEEYCNFLIGVRPKSLLDVGCGFGKYGFLAREYLDVWGNENYDPLGHNRTKIDAIEIYSPYLLGLQRIIYDHVYIGNALKILPTLSFYDMIVCVDVLEHFEKADGSKLLDMIKEKSKYGWVVTPTVVSDQGAVYGNVHETHKDSWTEADLKHWGDVSKAGNQALLLFILQNKA